MINMPLATCNRLWRQFCKAFRLGLYEKRDLNRYLMSNWREELDASHSIKQKIALKIDNDKTQIGTIKNTFNLKVRISRKNDR